LKSDILHRHDIGVKLEEEELLNLLKKFPLDLNASTYSLETKKAEPFLTLAPFYTTELTNSFIPNYDNST